MDEQNIMKDFLQQYDAGGNQINLPGFLKEYRVLSCTYEKPEKSCYLVADRNTDDRYLLKINKNTNGYDVLKAEHHRLCQLSEAFPKEYKTSIYQEEHGIEYLLKHYIQGMDLESYQEHNRPLSLQEILRIIIQICEQVEKLHALTPPMLHRDIKPKNLIIDYRGIPHLIDFETARNYCENKSKDTVLLGTKGNAAPEQYGYSQTDVRTDVYGIGKVLSFLYNENNFGTIKNTIPARQMKKIAQTATAFDPTHRYQSVSQLKRALNKVFHKVDERYLIKKIRVIGIAEAVTAVLLIISLLFGTRIFYQKTANPKPKDSIVSEPPKNMEAERAEKNMEDDQKDSDDEIPEKEIETTTASEGQTIFHTGKIKDVAKIITGKSRINREDYEKITQIAVIGNQIYETESNLEEIIGPIDFEHDLINGGIEDISLLSEMPNLKEVCLCGQKIIDISPLKGLPIESLYLSSNQISDFSVIETLEQLKVLHIADNPASTLPALSNTKQLLRLNLGGNNYDNLDFLKNSNVGNLDLCYVYNEDNDFSALEKMPNLTSLHTAQNQYTLYAQLPKIKQLKELSLWDYREKDLSIIKYFPLLQHLHVSGQVLKSLAGIENAPNIRNLSMDGSDITDISQIEKLKAISYIKINGNEIKDYTPLFHCDNLSRVSADDSQKREIERVNPHHTFQLADD